MQAKASYTVEAALICPVICLILCGMIVFTLELYTKAEQLSQGLQLRKEERIASVDLIRIEAVIEETLQEVK